MMQEAEQCKSLCFTIHTARMKRKAINCLGSSAHGPRPKRQGLGTLIFLASRTTLMAIPFRLTPLIVATG